MTKRLNLQTGAQMFALWAGIIYLLIGVIGFVATGFSHFASISGSMLLVFELNPLHNLVHLVLGGVWLWGAYHSMVAKRINLVLGIALALISLLGFFGALGFLAIEGAGSFDNFLHLITAVLALYFGYADVEMRRPAAA